MRPAISVMALLLVAVLDLPLADTFHAFLPAASFPRAYLSTVQPIRGATPSSTRGHLEGGKCVRKQGVRRGLGLLGLKGKTVVRTVTDDREVRALALLCLESFYGPQRPLDFLNPVGSVQRALVLQQVEQDLYMRVGQYRNGSDKSRVCGACLMALDEITGQAAGFVDVSLTLFDADKQKFAVSLGPGTFTTGPGTERRPYLANLAVSPKYQRQGIARQLVAAAENRVLSWSSAHGEADAGGEGGEDSGVLGQEVDKEGKAKEGPLWQDKLWLEVSATNKAALALYKSLGYTMAWQDNDAREVVRRAFTYEFSRVVRVCLFKELSSS